MSKRSPTDEATAVCRALDSSPRTASPAGWLPASEALRAPTRLTAPASNSAACIARYNGLVMTGPLAPTSAELMNPAHRPYVLWWTDATVAEFRARLADPDPDVRAYWMAALLREANTRDVWVFVTPEMIRGSWDRLRRNLGRSRAM